MAHAEALIEHYRLPAPWLSLRQALRDGARAAADVSDGLLADAGHVATASGLGLVIDLDALPLSPGGSAWVADQSDRLSALRQLASGGDDYALVCAVAPDKLAQFSGDVTRNGGFATTVGRFRTEPGLSVTLGGRPVAVEHEGWRH